MLNSFLHLQKRFGARQWSFLGPVQRKWNSISEDSPQGERDKMAKLMMGHIQRKRTSSLSSHKSIVQRSAQKQRRWKIVDPLLCRPGNHYNCFSHDYFCKSAQSLRGSGRNVWRKMNPITREDPLWENSRVPRSCRMWSTQTCLWTITIAKKWENELKSYHNKTNWANFVRMQDSWQTVWSRTVLHDKRHWRILTIIYRFSSLSWVTLCQETKIHLNRRVGSEGTPKLGPYWKIQPVACKVNTELRSESCLWTQTIPTHGSEFSHGLNKLVTDLNNYEQETSEMQFEEYALRLNAGDFASRSKAKAKPQKRDFASSSTRTIPLGRELGLMSNQENSRYPIIQCRRNWSIFFVMEAYLETMMERLNSG